MFVCPRLTYNVFGGTLSLTQSIKFVSIVTDCTKKTADLSRVVQTDILEKCAVLTTPPLHLVVCFGRYW